MLFCICFISEKASPISIAFLALIPLTSASLDGAYSIISRVSFPNLETMLNAVIGPIPLIKPEERYLIMPSAEVGVETLIVLTENCSPYLVCFIKSPLTSTFSPSLIGGNLPTAVIGSPLTSRTATV